MNADTIIHSEDMAFNPLCTQEEVPYDMERYEDAIKTIDASVKVLRDYRRSLDTLEGKIEACEHIKYLETVRMHLRRNYFNQEDAINA